MNGGSLFRSVAAVVVCAAAACGPQQQQPPADTSVVDASAVIDSGIAREDVAVAPMDTGVDTGLPPPPEDASAYDGGQTFRHEVSISIDLMPGQEVTRCTIVRLNNTTAQYIRRVYANLGDASHHLIFYKSSRRTEQTTPQNCTGFSGVRNLMDFDPPILIAQQHETTLNMPPNVGFPIDADEYVRLEFHAVNLRTTPMRATATVVVDSVDQSVPLTSANLMFWGNTRISLSPMAAGTVDFFHTPLVGVRVFGLTSHTHQYGVRSTIHRATGTRSASTPVSWSNVVDGALLHDNRNWSDPPLTLFDPPITFPTGEGLHLRCNYMNTSNRTVTFGESVDQEMCFLWAYYYPAPRGTQVCAIGYTAGNTVACFPPS